MIKFLFLVAMSSVMIFGSIAHPVTLILVFFLENG